MYLGQAFQVRSSGSPNTYAYGTPTSPWCLYTGRITAARWNKFEDGLLADKLFFQCVVGFCTIMDGAAGTDEKRCHNVGIIYLLNSIFITSLLLLSCNVMTLCQSFPSHVLVDSNVLSCPVLSH